MPFILLPDGTKRYVDLLINVLGVVNRGNPFQLMEVSINHIGDEICNYIHFTEGLTYDEKINELYKFYDIFNKEQGKQLKEYYENVLTTDSKKDLFFEKLYKEKIFVQMKILWEEEPIFEKIAKAYNTFKYAGYSKVFIHKWGRDIPIMSEVIVGDMYMFKLLQTDKKSFMSRSLAGIGVKNVPEKDNKSKTHHDLYAKTPVRKGLKKPLCTVMYIEDLFNCWKLSIETISSQDLIFVIIK